MRRQTKFVIAVFIIGIGVVYTWATWRYFTIPVPGGNDFMAHYTAWEAYLRHGMNPYSDEAALYTQQAIYGRPARPGEDQNRLTYPFYSILAHAPFLVFDYPLARAVYMTLLQAALLAGLWMTLDWLRWRPPAWLLGILFAWTLLSYPQARGIILGQFAIFGFFSLAGSLYLLRHSKDVAAGALLVLSTVKPTLVFLVVPFLLLWGLSRRRWRFLIGFFSLLAVLVIGSLIALPTWIGDMLFRVDAYSAYTVGQSPVWLLAHQYLPGLGTVGEWILTGILLAAVLVSWVRSLYSAGDASFAWVLGFTLLVSNMIIPRSATTNYVMLLIPILWIFAALDRSGQWGRKVTLLGMLVSLVGLWWLHFITVQGNQEQAVMFLPLPLTLGILWLCGSKWLARDAAIMQLGCSSRKSSLGSTDSRISNIGSPL